MNSLILEYIKLKVIVLTKCGKFNPGPAEPNMSCLCKQCRSRSVEEANWSGSTLFAIQYVNLYQQSGSSNLIGWKFEKGVVS